VTRIADHVCAIEQLRKHALREGERLLETHRIQTVREIGLLVALNDESAHRVFVRIDVGLEPAVFGALERLHERVVGPVGAEPHVAALAEFEIGLEVRGMTGADGAVDAVGGNDQIGTGETAVVVGVGLVLDPHAQAFGALLQDIEQAPPVNAAHAVAAGDDHLAAVVDVDIVPVAKAGEDVAVRLGVGFAQVVQRGIREHHPEAEGVVRAVALENGDLMARIRKLHQDGKIQPGRAGAYT